MPTFDLTPDLRLYYSDNNRSGTRTILLLHGLGVTGESWQLQIPTLTGVGFRVIAPDARGFGQSTYPGRVSPALMAGDMALLLNRLETGPVDVAGISMGGTTALQLALDYPELVNRLVLVNTFACLQPAQPATWLYFASRYVLIHTLGLTVQARAVAQRLFPNPDQYPYRQAFYEQVIQANPRGYRAAMRSLALFDVRRRLKEISIPTLVVTGECDTIISPKLQSCLVESIRNAHQVIIPAAGHAVTVDQAKAFNRVINEFLCRNHPI